MDVAVILDNVDIVDYISQYCDLEPRDGEYWGLSPFNDEKTPSFSVNRETKIWHDFSAGFGGNMIEFVKRYHQVSVSKAISMLKKFAGITDEEGEEVASQRLQAAKIAKRFRRRARKTRQKCVATPLPDTVMNKFEFRKEMFKPWLDEGISLEAIKKFVVRYDPLLNRIVFPIRDFDGSIVYLSGRTCDSDYKEKGIRKYTYYSEIGAVETLYGFSDNVDQIMEKREIILFEGAKSVMKAWGWGIQNTAAILTSHLSEALFEHLIRLASFHHVRIVFALDSDVDIRKDANIIRLCSYAQVEWIRNRRGLLAPKESPVDKGEEVFRTLYDEREVVK